MFIVHFLTAVLFRYSSLAMIVLFLVLFLSRLTDVSLFVSDVVHFPKPTESELHVENPGNDYVLG